MEEEIEKLIEFIAEVVDNLPMPPSLGPPLPKRMNICWPAQRSKPVTLQMPDVPEIFHVLSASVNEKMPQDGADGRRSRRSRK